jgi:hypothetical protein
MEVRRSLLCESLPPTGTWLYVLEEDGSLIGDCGRCASWWFVGEWDTLEEALSCRECLIERARKVEIRPASVIEYSCTHCSTPEDCAAGYSDCRHRKAVKL